MSIGFKKPIPILAIDPGINIGLAGWNGIDKCPTYFKCIEGKSKDWKYNTEIVSQIFEIEISQIKKHYLKCYIERPRFHESFKGLTAAKSDSLFKLIFMYGLIYSALYRNSIKVEEVEIVHWKGQLDKKKTEFRVRRFLPELPATLNNHIIDAVGIGLYAQGYKI